MNIIIASGAKDLNFYIVQILTTTVVEVASHLQRINHNNNLYFRPPVMLAAVSWALGTGQYALGVKRAIGHTNIAKIIIELYYFIIIIPHSYSTLFLLKYVQKCFTTFNFFSTSAMIG